MHEYAHAQFYSYGDDELMHYGRKGMKWGQNIFAKVRAYSIRRKKVKNLEKARAAKVQKQKTEAERKDLLAKGKIKPKDMTSEELKAMKERFQLEKDYKDLLKESRQSGLGYKFVSKFTASTVEKLADNVASDLFAQTLKAAGAKVINDAWKRTFEGDQDVVFTNNKKKN